MNAKISKSKLRKEYLKAESELKHFEIEKHLLKMFDIKTPEEFETFHDILCDVMEEIGKERLRRTI